MILLVVVVVIYFFLLVLGIVKEMNDDVICWFGYFEDLLDLYGFFDFVFFNFVMMIVFFFGDLLGVVVSFCNYGVKIVIGCS